MTDRTASIYPDDKPDVRVTLARMLLTREVGQRIATVQEIQSIVGAGSGTVVKALRSLEAAGAVTLEARGHQGTVVVERHAGRLWNAADLGNLTILLPPPGPVEHQLLQDAFRSVLTRLGVPLVIDYARGARHRLEAVHLETAQATVTSAGAFAQHRDAYPGLVAFDLGKHSYYAAGSLVVVEHATRPPGRPVRVGVDRSSYDHLRLTEAELAGDGVELVECSFVMAPAAVLEGAVDAAVWHSMPTVIPPEPAGLRLRPLRTPAARELVGEISSAVLVTRSLDAGTNAVLRHVGVADVARAQKAAATTEGGTGLLWPR